MYNVFKTLQSYIISLKIAKINKTSEKYTSYRFPLTMQPVNFSKHPKISSLTNVESFLSNVDNTLNLNDFNSVFIFNVAGDVVKVCLFTTVLPVLSVVVNSIVAIFLPNTT